MNGGCIIRLGGKGGGLPCSWGPMIENTKTFSKNILGEERVKDQENDRECEKDRAKLWNNHISFMRMGGISEMARKFTPRGGVLAMILPNGLRQETMNQEGRIPWEGAGRNACSYEKVDSLNCMGRNVR